MRYFLKGKVYIQAAFMCVILCSFFAVPFVHADKNEAEKKGLKTDGFSPVAKLLEAENLTVLAQDIISEAAEKKNIALAFRALKLSDEALGIIADVTAYAVQYKSKALLKKCEWLKKKNEKTKADALALINVEKPESLGDFDLPALEEPPVKDLNPSGPNDLAPASPI